MKKIIEKLIFFFTSILAKCKYLTIKFLDWLKERNYSSFFNKRTKIISLVILLIILVAQIFFGVMIYGFKAEDRITRIAAKIVPYPIVIVNYNVVTYNDFLVEKDYIHHFYEATKQDTSNFSDVDKQILSQLIDSRVIDFEALISNVRVSKQEINTTFDDIAAQNGGHSQVEKVLNDLYGLNINQFKGLIKDQLLRSKLDDKLIARVKVSHILIKVESGATPDKIEAAKTKIEGIRKEIEGGLSFTEAAKKYSEDTTTAEQGGALESFAKGEMVDQFSNSAFQTKVGEISDPVLSEYGWHIIKVESKGGKYEKTFTEWLSNIQKKSLILHLINL